MPILRVKCIKREDLKLNREWLFVFGDNLARRGYGGQAKEMRGEINAIGIPTKIAPGMNQEDFFRNHHWFDFLNSAIPAFDIIEEALKQGRGVVIPLDGIGTGLARLKETAPMLFGYIEGRIQKLEKRYGTRELKLGE